MNIKNCLVLILLLINTEAISQPNEVPLIGLKRVDPFVFTEQGNNYYFNTTLNGKAAKNSFSELAASITVNKCDKVTHKILKSAHLIGDTTQTDSTITTYAQYSCYSNGKLYYAFNRHYFDDTFQHPHPWKSIVLTVLDTNLNTLIPEKRLNVYTLPNTSFFGQCELQSLTVVGSRIFISYIQWDTLGLQQYSLSRYIIADLQGNILKEGVVGISPLIVGSYTGFHQVFDVIPYTNNNLIVPGVGILCNGSGNSFVVTDSTMNVLDTFVLNSNIGAPLGAFNDIPFFVTLPTGSIIIGGSFSAKDNSGFANDYSAIAKLSVNYRFKLDTISVFMGKNGRVDNHNPYPSLHSLDYNKFDNRVYYSFADKTHRWWFDPCYDTSNYVEVILVDTNLHTKWRKFVSPKNHSCASITRVVASDQRSGVDVTGYYNDSVTPSDTSLGGSFIYHMDSSGTLDVRDVNNFIVRDRFRIYPNPSTDIVFVDDILRDISTISVYDIQGREIQRNKAVVNSNSISFGKYPPGNYLIRLSLNDGSSFSQSIIHK